MDFGQMIRTSTAAHSDCYCCIGNSFVYSPSLHICLIFYYKVSCYLVLFPFVASYSPVSACCDCVLRGQ